MVGREQLKVRSFAELPIDDVVAYVPTETAYLAMSPAERTAHDQVALAETAENTRKATAVGRMAGAFGRGDPSTMRYLGRHIGDYDLIEAEFNRTQAPRTFAGIVKAGLAADIAVNGTTLAVYQRLSALYPNTKALDILKEAFIEAFVTAGSTQAVAKTQFTALFTNNRATIGSAPPLIVIVNANHGNVPALRTAVMQYLLNNRGQAPTAENDYNTVVPTLGHAGVPQTLGEIVNDFFVSELQARGKGLAVFADLADSYPAFEYRLRPAFRFVFGDEELQKVTEKRRSAKAAADVADPGSTANLDAKKAFLAHPMYTQLNFASSIESAAKFDVTYDPRTTELKVVVKLSFTWNDNTTTDQPAKIKKKEVGKQYGEKTWTDEAKTKFKNDLRTNILGIWNPTAPTIRCIKPGWEDIVAKPVFDIVEYPTAEVSTTTSVPRRPFSKPSATAPTKNLKAQGVSARGTDTGLKELTSLTRSPTRRCTSTFT